MFEITVNGKTYERATLRAAVSLFRRRYDRLHTRWQGISQDGRVVDTDALREELECSQWYGSIGQCLARGEAVYV